MTFADAVAALLDGVGEQSVGDDAFTAPSDGSNCTPLLSRGRQGSREARANHPDDGRADIRQAQQPNVVDSAAGYGCESGGNAGDQRGPINRSSNQ